MTIKVATTWKSGASLAFTLEDITPGSATFGYYWNDGSAVWQSAPTFGNKSVTLTEGTSENLGSYTGTTTSSGMGASLIRVRIHDTGDSNRCINIFEVVCDSSSNQTTLNGVNVAKADGVAWNSGAITSSTLAANTGLVPLRTGTAQSGGSGFITLDSGASAVDDAYVFKTVVITGGTGSGQSAAITGYDGTSKIATTSPDWAVNPNSSSTFAILGIVADTKILNDGINIVGDNVIDIQSRIPAALTADGNIKADMQHIQGVSSVPFSKSVPCIAYGTADAGASATSIPTSAMTPAGGVADQFKGRILIFDKDTTTAALRGQATDITASSNSATPTFTVTALMTAPASGDTFVIL